MTKMPVYRINDFEDAGNALSFYVNKLNAHVKHHPFTNLPHKHDFYLLMLVTKGTGWHEIDFKKYTVKAGSVFLMQPGQMHYWNLSKDIDGFVFFHSKNFFDEGYTSMSLHDLPFYRSLQNLPYLSLNKREIPELTFFMKGLLKENSSRQAYRISRLRSLVNLIYTHVARAYPETQRIDNGKYLEQFQRLETLIESYYREQKLPGFYAEAMHISEKHLNRIVRECVNKTSTQVIADRVILEAKRVLMNTKLNVTEAGDVLGFADTSYFVRFFKKHTGITPLRFLKRY